MIKSTGEIEDLEKLRKNLDGYKANKQNTRDSPCYYCSFWSDGLAPMACEYCIHYDHSDLYNEINLKRKNYDMTK